MGKLSIIKKSLDKAKERKNLLALASGAGLTIGADESEASFIGALAKTFDTKALNRAKEMKIQGASRDEIWKQTGDEYGTPTYFDGDGKWKQEIDDSSAIWARGKVRNQALSKAYREVEGQEDIADITWLINKSMQPEEGSYMPHGYEKILLGSENISSGSHELQHAVQQREGFAQGGSPINPEKTKEAIKLSKKQLKKLQKLQKEGEEGLDSSISNLEKRIVAQEQQEMFPELSYHQLAGEAEARNVQKRLMFPMSQRIDEPPWSTIDVEEDDLIYQGMRDVKGLAEAAKARKIKELKLDDDFKQGKPMSHRDKRKAKQRAQRAEEEGSAQIKPLAGVAATGVLGTGAYSAYNALKDPLSESYNQTMDNIANRERPEHSELAQRSSDRQKSIANTFLNRRAKRGSPRAIDAISNKIKGFEGVAKTIGSGLLNEAQAGLFGIAASLDPTTSVTGSQMINQVQNDADLMYIPKTQEEIDALQGLSNIVDDTVNYWGSGQSGENINQAIDNFNYSADYLNEQGAKLDPRLGAAMGTGLKILPELL